MILNNIPDFKNCSVYVINLNDNLLISKYGDGHRKICILYSFNSKTKIGHFDTVVPDKLHTLFGKNHFCFYCLKAYHTRIHKCKAAWCTLCNQVGCMNVYNVPINYEKYVTCDRCKKRFPTKFCLKNHTVGNGLCNQFIEKCKKCKRNIYEKTKYIHARTCGQRYCHICK